MIKNYLFLTLFFSVAISTSAQVNVKQAFDVASKQFDLMLANHPDSTQFPFSVNPDGTSKDSKSVWWCSGFFGGSLWSLYEFTNDNKWKAAANRWTMAVSNEQYNTNTHDLGFMLYCPFGSGYRLTQNEAYKSVLLKGAESLATRFDPKVGLIKSWNKFQEKYEYPVIIDNMMNLELLFWASKTSGNPKYYNICVTHADNTLKNHFREDFSSYHVVCYGPNGEVLAKKTHQGAADESAWARGQAWGLYGYTVMYRETKDKKYLKVAKNIAKFILENPNLPEDKIPYWDFSKPGEERDASAGAITASALLEISQYVSKKEANYYKAMATKMLESLSNSYFRADGGNNGFILKHSTGNKAGNVEVDVPLNYADYYYLEALLRYKKMTHDKW
jgi:rhamnogalacturonyl hydrolase YesR